MIDYRQLVNDLIRDEGMRLKPYVDSVEKTTLGVGRNLSDNGISEAEARLMLDNDITAATKDLNRNIPWWQGLPEPARRGLVNMAFNLGWPRLSKFERMLAALELESFDIAAAEALNSTWARQVGEGRAERIAALFRQSQT